MATRVVGVDIGYTMLRAVEVEGPNKTRPTVLRYHEFQMPEGAARSGEVLEVNTVATALRRLWSAAGFTTKNVVLGMGNQRVLARDLTIPKLSQAQIRESLPFQVQEMLPIPVSDALLDFYPISESLGENGPVINGLLVAAVKEAVLANVMAVQMAGLAPVEVDLIPFALTRANSSSTSARGAVIAVIDVGAFTTNVVVTISGVPQFVRIIPVGGEDITTALMKRCDLSDAVAQQAKRALGMLPTSQEHSGVSEVINEVAQEHLAGLRNTISYFDNTHNVGNVSRIVISGGGARLTGFTNALSQLTRTQVVVADPFADLNVSRRASKDAAHSRESMSVALGLALGSAA